VVNGTDISKKHFGNDFCFPTRKAKNGWCWAAGAWSKNCMQKQKPKLNYWKKKERRQKLRKVDGGNTLGLAVINGNKIMIFVLAVIGRDCSIINILLYFVSFGLWVYLISFNVKQHE